MPCNQMISMNCRPPRPTEASRPARLAIAKLRIRNRRSSNIGEVLRSSITTNATSRRTPPTMAPSTHGFPHPVVESP
jgi:hypothetical protein